MLLPKYDMNVPWGAHSVETVETPLIIILSDILVQRNSIYVGFMKNLRNDEVARIAELDDRINFLARYSVG